MKVLSSYVALLLLVFSGYGQVSRTVSGKVIDVETKEPLVYASVWIEGRKISTITNNQGRFDFHIPQQNLKDTLTISMLGYKSFNSPISTLIKEKDLIISLERDIIVLDEVVIHDTLDAGEIVQVALNKIEVNNPMEPYGMEAFYRDIKKVDGEYVSLLEAAIEIFDKGYKDPRNPFRLKERVGLKEIRKSVGYTAITNKWFDQNNLLEEILLHNNVKYRTFPEEEIFFKLLHLEDITSYNGHLVYEIQLEAEYDLKLYIDATTYGIVRVEFEMESGDEPIRVFKKSRTRSNYINRIKRIIDFQEYDGKYYLSYLNVEMETQWHNTRENKPLVTTQLFQELLINNLLLENYDVISSNERMKSYGLQYHEMPYNKSFWEDYNVIKDSPLETTVIRDLEKKRPLEEQFRKQ